MTDHTSHVPAAPDANPLRRFGELLERARASTEIREPTAMSLATADERGRPSVRIVLLKGFDERGFVFYTNLGSRKGRELAANPFAALCFHWQPFEVQVRVEGAVQAVDAAEADEYFASRARGSQVGAWASRQSTELPARVDLDQRIAFVEARFGDGAIPRPEFWSGFRVVPERIEFWQGRPSRLHERDVYARDLSVPGTWRTGQLYP
ncbi:MAG TPA: pyridoxamine 5'-phosphate oxidase [Longimicrobiaceae bacterium]|nr:pyridoxamine 5'-phosphate oxidase [Longimicrobiaceae bacterium]